MGPATDPLAVIDQRGRVHGLAGLRVADCSIMPDCVRANTNATAMMIGERLADLIDSGRPWVGMPKPQGEFVMRAL